MLQNNEKKKHKFKSLQFDFNIVAFMKLVFKLNIRANKNIKLSIFKICSNDYSKFIGFFIQANYVFLISFSCKIKK